MARYDYGCSKCGAVTERVLPMRSDGKATLKCLTPKCRGRCRRLFNGQFQINATPVSNQFPYVSTRLPFGIQGETHVGPLKKTLVKNKQHKDRLYKKLGFVRE